VRVVLFQNWSLLGCVICEELLKLGRDETMLVGSHVPSLDRDPQLVALARRLRVPLLVPRDVRDPGFLRRLRDFAPDVLLVVTFPVKLPNLLLELPRIAAVNLHPSFLPGYRGACPEFWVIRNGEATTGITLHRMTERFDAGEILGQRRLPIRADDTMLSLTERMLQPGFDLVMELLESCRAGQPLVGRPQDPALVSRAPMVRPEHLLVDWSEPAEALERLVRAAHPAYEVRCRFRSLELRLHRVVLVPEGLPALAPGELLVLPAERRLLAGTGKGLLELLRLEVTHGAAQSGWDLCEKNGVRSGERLG
jgi:methionyl-tRNA formyltransferase